MMIKCYTFGSIYLIIFVVEFVISFRKGSVALLADAYYNLFQSSLWFLFGTQVRGIEILIHLSWLPGDFNNYPRLCVYRRKVM